MEDNNNQSTPEFEKKNPIVEKLKQVRKKHFTYGLLHWWFCLVLVLRYIFRR